MAFLKIRNKIAPEFPFSRGSATQISHVLSQYSAWRDASVSWSIPPVLPAAGPIELIVQVSIE